jgi:hypothetical protein
MGNNASVLHNNYICSNYSLTSDIECHEYELEVDLSHLLKSSKDLYGLIYSVFYYKIKHVGYLTPKNQTVTLNNIQLINTVKMVYRTIKIKDLIVDIRNYLPRLQVIKYFLSSGYILIAGMIMDTEFIKEVFNIDSPTKYEIVLILGYTPEYIIVKNVSTSFNVPIKFITHVKEIINISINSPEEKYCI